MSKYETVIGLEVHIQLNTNSKVFCGDSAAFGSEPNEHISAISLGHPGTLPRLNEGVLEKAIRLGLALNCEISNNSFFDRKNYFYADLPKGYQITQDENPICQGGFLEITVQDQTRKIRIHHIHIEEDAGKSIHDLDPRFSCIDLNRAGVPLLEVVTEPDLRSPEEAAIFFSELRKLAKWLDISDGNMEEGSMRCDCNLSLRPMGSSEYGTRTEVKNVNSIRFAKKALEYEQERQTKVLNKGEKVIQQTRTFDPESGKTYPLREKEEAHDYRYFPEPDLPVVNIVEEDIIRIQNSMPEMPAERKSDFIQKYQLSEYEAALLTEEKMPGDYFLFLIENNSNYKLISNLLINKILPEAKELRKSLFDFPIEKENIHAFIELISSNKVSASIAYQRVWPELLKHPNTSPEEMASKLNVLQNSDTDFLESAINNVLEKFPDKVTAYQKGKKGLIGFFMGEVMKATRGKADPKLSNQMLRKKLES